MTWSVLDIKGHIPEARHRHSFSKWTDKTFVLFGGEHDLNLTKMFNDVHLFDSVSQSWHLLKTTGDVPPPTGSHTAFVFHDCLYVVGGRTSDWLYLSDMFCLDLREFKILFFLAYAMHSKTVDM